MQRVQDGSQGGLINSLLNTMNTSRPTLSFFLSHHGAGGLPLPLSVSFIQFRQPYVTWIENNWPLG